MNFDQAVADLIDGCPGACGAAIVDPDGIPVAARPRGAALEVLAAEFASIVRNVGEAGRELSHGGLRQLWVSAEAAEVVVTCMGGGYFLLLLLDPDALTGRGRFQSRLLGERLYAEFL